MPEPTYSVYFTGIWLNEAGAESRMALLRRLFPHADDERLGHFLDHRRVLLIHGEPLDAAKRLVMALYAHGLECDIAEDAEVAPDVAAMMASPAMPHKAPEAAQSPTPTPQAPLQESDEFTPRGRALLRALLVATALLVVVASWSAWHRLNRVPAAALDDIPTVCAADTEMNWYGRTQAHLLACSARAAGGARYRLVVRCARGGGLQATLSFHDARGQPRSPDWDGAGGTQRTIRYAGGDGIARVTVLRRAEAGHVGALAGLDAAALVPLLAAPALDIADVFAGEAVRFDLETARWYIDYFEGACGLTDAAR
ncbi:hypothetical protein AAG565_06085 [Fontimonas sp. SYSU GA230001]|uniref:hypothetical protein n=1 Tax=Fontimonas sp. SYSU GA230001 TaxID=3142450 RepID=UPI0032B313F4